MVPKVKELPLLLVTYIPIYFSYNSIETWIDQMKILYYDVDFER